MKGAVIAVVLLGLLGASMAACPNHCSGRGKCVDDDRCMCFQRYTGPDCSQRLCKENIAWVANVAAPHQYEECAGKGNCDRVTGECVCHDGFDGAACQRMTCPNDCSGHGTCEYITEISDYGASNWDSTKIQGCKCDGGWEGYDCSLRMCPRGDDPLTTHSDTGDIWTVTTDASDQAITGQAVWIVKDLYGTYETSRPFAIADADEATAALVDTDIIIALDTAGVTRSVGGTNSYGQAYVVNLADPAHITSITVESKGCNSAACYPYRYAETASAVTTTFSAVTSSITTATVTNLEAAVCSNRGICDQASGICACFEGHTGLACEVQTILV